MDDKEIKIEELVLRIPELTEEEANGLGKEVARRVADGLPSQSSLRELGALNLRVTVTPGTPCTQMASVIAEAILKGVA